MWSAKVKEDGVLLELFEDSGRNVQRASVLLRDLFAEYPEQAELAAAVRDCEHDGDRIAHEILSRLAEHGAALDAADVHALTGAWTTSSTTPRRRPTSSGSMASRRRWSRPSR